MRIRIRYFASLREALGDGEVMDIEVKTLGTLRDVLIARGGAYAQSLAREGAVRGAVDQALADDGAPLRDGAEVAFFPPVTGG